MGVHPLNLSFWYRISATRSGSNCRQDETYHIRSKQRQMMQNRQKERRPVKRYLQLEEPVRLLNVLAEQLLQ